MTATTTLATKSLIAVKAKLSRGYISSEARYVIELANGKNYKGTTPLSNCWNNKGNPLRLEDLQQPIKGLLSAKFIEQLQYYRDILIELPNGITVAVDIEQIDSLPQ